MTVQVGSSAVVVGISVKGKVVFYNAPHATPYTYVFTPSPHPEPDRRPGRWARRPSVGGGRRS